MENLSQICRKIMQGPQMVYPNANVTSGSAFLDILAMMNQTEVVETVVVDTVIAETDVGEGVVSAEEGEIVIEDVEIEDAASPNETMSQELIQMLLSQIPIQIDLINEATHVVEQENQPVVIQTNTIQQNVPVENQGLEKPIQKEVIPEFKGADVEKVLVQKEVVIEKVLPQKDIELVEKTSGNEIQKHFKVLNQNVRLKEILKNDESIPVNTEKLNQTEFVVKKEVELTEVEMNQFKQSIQEMKMNLENITRKDDETIVFKLKPEGLAEIVIKFEQKLGKVTLDISTSNRMVEQLIQKELPHLRDSLKSYQMEVNLSEMGFKNQSNQSHQTKSHQDKLAFNFDQDESVEEEWMILPQTYGFNTYV